MRILGYAALFLVALAGSAQATSELLGGPTPKVFHREAALAGKGSEASVSRVRRGPRGPRGPQGTAGATGAQGAPGTFGTISSVRGYTTFLCGWFEGSCSVGNSKAACPPGTRLISGGYSGAGIRAFISGPLGNSWSVSATNESEFPTSFEAIAMCAS